MRKLNNILEEIKKWCADNRIGIFYGSIERGSPTRIIWTNEDNDNNDYLNFLQSIKNSNAKSLVVEFEKNDLDLNDYDIGDYLNAANSDMHDDYRNSWKIIHKNKGEILSIKLTYIDYLASFIYETTAEWKTDYHIILDLIDKGEDNDTEIEEESNLKIINIDNETVERIAQIIVEDDEFLKSKDSIEKRGIAYRIAADNGIGHNQWYNQKLISERAQQIFIKDIKPIQDKHLKEKIVELKEKGLTKVKISGQLGISMTELNKLLYSL